jgi:hypothetical protein
MSGVSIASKIHEDTGRIKLYSEQLLALVRKEFRTQKINMYDYERFINILTCLNLQTDETRESIKEFINIETEKHIASIDIRI